jgi:hypothetical protein
MLYMFLLYWNENDPPVPPEIGIREHFAFADVARARGAYVCSEAIGGGRATTTVRVREGKRILIDGPFAESKEVMGGFYILDCRDLDEALEYAAMMPDAKYAGVEVRPVMDVSGWEYGALGTYRRHSMNLVSDPAQLNEAGINTCPHSNTSN